MMNKNILIVKDVKAWLELAMEGKEIVEYDGLRLTKERDNDDRETDA